MKFTDLFINRPVIALVVSAFLLILGIQSVTKLPIREFPALEKGQIRVNTFYPGASARTVQGFVTNPLQRRVANARGVEYLTSRSNPGQSQIIVHVRLGENTSEVLSEVIAKVNEARSELPRDIEDPVVNTSDGGDALMYLAFLSEKLSEAQVTDYLLRAVQPELATLEGVGTANILGSKQFAMRIWLDPDKMAALEVTAEDVSRGIRAENYISTAGTTKGNLVRATVDARTHIQTEAEFANMVIRQDGDLRVQLGDIADIELAAQSTESAQFSSGQRTVFLSIETAPGANPLEVATRVRDALPRLTKQMPADLTIFLDFDGSIYIQEALKEVVTTLLEAALIVVLVIYLFLGSVRVVLIPLVAIPLSLVGVLFMISIMGFSLNLLTLLAMVIAIGLVVDDAIVVVENVHRHIENGKTPFDAAIIGARQVALPVIAMTLTLAAVYAPIGFLGGLTGKLFSEFALTLAGAVFVSGVVALTLSPVMCATVLQDHDHQGKLADWLDQTFFRLKNGYQHLLMHCLNNRGAVLLFAGAIIISLPVFFQLAQKELAPEEDSASMFVMASAPSYANVDYVNRFLDEIVAIWKTVPEIASSWQVSSPNSVFGGLALTPWGDRERTQAEVQRELQAKFSRVSGLEIFTFGSPPLPGTEAGLPVNFVIATTAEYVELDRVAQELLAAARQSGLFIFVNRSLQFTRPEITVGIDRDKAARLGISMRAIGDTLAIMLGEADINRFTMDGRSYKVIPQASRDFRLTKEWLQRYYLRTSSGDLVPLSTVIELGQRVEPNSLTQYQQLNSTTIQGMMMPPNTLGTGLEFLEAKMKEIAPTDFRAGYEGESRRFLQETQSFAPLFGISLLLIFLVLAVQFNSFRDPFVVLITVPMSIFGAIVPLAMGIATLNIYTQIGLLTLIGLISKHGILIVDFANQQVKAGKTRSEAVLEAAALRLRPILMTTFATVLGVLPLLTAFGAGANSRFSIGLMIASGMVVGTVFTLFVVPVFYLPFGSDKPSSYLARPSRQASINSS
ncbi:MAG: efflux RND transporter permease subunit [bacterium]|nr:multidrug efflux protein [Gammaproteobacteria bacterium]